MNVARKDWLKWVAAGFALVATASAEYELARAIGMNEWVAIAVPGALDAYVIRALRAHREVLTAVIAMVLVNAASHLVSARLLPVDWWLITAVSAIAPLVLWRVHALRTPAEARTDTLWDVSEHTGNETRERAQQASTVPSTDAVSASVSGRTDAVDEVCSVCSHVHRHGELCGHVTGGYACKCMRGKVSTFDAHVSSTPGVSDYVPAEWSTPPRPTFEPETFGQLSTNEHGVSAQVLTLPVGYERAQPEGAREGDVDDQAALSIGRDWVQEHGVLPSLRTLKTECRVSTDRARRVLVTLKAEKEEGARS